MKSKYVFSFALVIVLLAVLTVSPVGLMRAIEVQGERQSVRSKLQTYERNLNTVSQVLVDTVSTFNDARTFDVYYGDVEKIRQIFKGVAGIEVKEVYEVDPFDNYREIRLLQENDSVEAVKFNLLTTDPLTAIGVLNKMELPMASIAWSEPNAMSVVFLTGGEV